MNVPELLAGQSAAVLYGWAAVGPILLIFAGVLGFCALAWGWLTFADWLGLPAWLSFGLLLAAIVAGLCLFAATVGIQA